MEEQRYALHKKGDRAKAISSAGTLSGRIDVVAEVTRVVPNLANLKMSISGDATSAGEKVDH